MKEAGVRITSGRGHEPRKVGSSGSWERQRNILSPSEETQPLISRNFR